RRAGRPLDTSGLKSGQHGLRVEGRLCGVDARLPRDLLCGHHGTAMLALRLFFARRPRRRRCGEGGRRQSAAGAHRRDGAQRPADGNRRDAVCQLFPLSPPDLRYLAGALLPVRAAAGGGRTRHGHRPGAGLVPDHPAVRAAARLSRSCRRRPAPRHLQRRPHHRYAVLSERACGGACPPRRRSKAQAVTSLLEVRNLEHSFGALRAVHDVSLTVNQGELLGLSGPNGAGKSTLYNLIAGALRPMRGEIVFSGENVTGWPAYKIARIGIARTFQIPKPYRQLSVIENVMVTALQRERSVARARILAEATLAAVGLDAHAASPIATLTVGLLKRLEVARALAMRPRLALFDEIMAGLTPTEVTVMTRFVAGLPGRGITVIWVEHVLYAIMKTASRILVLDRGELIANGPPRAVARDPAVVKAYLGEELNLA